MRDPAQGLERLNDGAHPLRRSFHGVVNRALEPRDPIGLVLDLMEVIQQGGLLRGVLKEHGFDPRQVLLRPRSHAVDGRRPWRKRNFPKRWRARS